MLDIGSFRFDSVVLEIRYENAYQLWDNAGRMWHDFAQLYPEIILDETEPNQQKFSGEEGLDFQAMINRAHIAQHRPPTNLKKFTGVSRDFCENVIRNLDLLAFSRIGLRVKYFKAFKSLEETTSGLLSAGLIKPPNKKTFNVDAPIKEAGVNFRTEDDEIGVHVSMKTENRKTEFRAPHNTPEFESKVFEESGIVYDVDYYTCSPTLVAQFKPVDWIEQSHQLIRRESSSYLGGG